MDERMTLVWDWGDTLMRVFDQAGPMAEWPQVQEIDGVVEALEALLPRAHMYVATNALDSTPEQVWKALRRAGLGEYFQTVFTAATTGAQKPALAFFQKIEEVVDRPAHEIVMIGDGYAADILGAKLAGWRAVWYNPAAQPAAGSYPSHDGEVQRMADLPRILSQPWLPDMPACLSWLQANDVPHNILLHVQVVAAAAYLLACWLRQVGQQVDPVLVHRGGLLHDIAKLASIRLGPHSDHARMARDILQERYHQPALAEIADRHVVNANPADPRFPRTWEEKLVHFADKLAEGARLVSLDERLAELQNRYPASARQINDSAPAARALQAEICQAIGISPEQMMAQLTATLMGSTSK